ncbi:hypothetical protein K438DRAFT_1759131 [Mycena galopus ATCC 62051]|nr:hypothetical protein K438DRAFT_1759131 [Mycena galopus ATCC 62051]
MQSLNAARNFATAVRKLGDYKQFVDAVVEMNIPRLQQLVSVDLQRGSSPIAIVRMMQSALEGAYHPRPILDSRTLNIALMVYRLGGRKLLYAVNHELGLPSLRTLRNHMPFTKITPTVGTISVEDIIHNICEVVLKPQDAAAIHQPLRGVSLLIDEAALKLHWRSAPAISVIIIVSVVSADLKLKTYDDALKIAEKIKLEEVHLRKEMTVVSASCFGESGTYPILAVPTCKHVSPEESSTIYETITNAWIEHASAHVGMPWSWATDGLCTLLRSAAGMALCNGRIINPAVLTRFMARLPEQTDDSVRKLLFPDDPQDVPRAVELMEAIIDFIACNFGEVDADTAADFDSFRLLAIMLKSILAPFITLDMSLTEQMTHLLTYTHILFTLFRMNRLTFMSNQLYRNSQSMIKNVLLPGQAAETRSHSALLLVSNWRRPAGEAVR